MSFFKNHEVNKAGDYLQTSFSFLKALDQVEESNKQLSFNIFQQPSTWHKIKIKYIKSQTINPEIFNFSDQGLGAVSPSHSGYDFPRKMFFMSYSINFPQFIE